MTEIQLFKDNLSSEIKRLTKLCEIWERVPSDSISEEFYGKILSTTGQSKLLIKEKLRQFENLICMYDNSRGTKVTLNDLQGFWDLVNIQIEDVDRKFKDIELGFARQLHQECEQNKIRHC